MFSEQESIKSLIVETIGKYILVSQANQWKLKRTFRQYSSFSSFVQRVFTKFVSLFVLQKINCKQKKKNHRIIWKLLPIEEEFCPKKGWAADFSKPLSGFCICIPELEWPHVENKWHFWCNPRVFKNVKLLLQKEKFIFLFLGVLLLLKNQTEKQHTHYLGRRESVRQFRILNRFNMTYERGAIWEVLWAKEQFWWCLWWFIFPQNS